MTEPLTGNLLRVDYGFKPLSHIDQIITIYTGKNCDSNLTFSNISSPSAISLLSIFADCSH
ncbi:MAG: hypothetical protein R2744_13340 [Bacteroidales bacterium]